MIHMTKRIEVNSNICTGCRYCEAICSVTHEKRQVNPRLTRIKVVSNILGGKDDPKVCHQCAKPLCMSACPSRAIELDAPLGIPKIIESKCTGCRVCVTTCPFGEMFFDERRNIAIKCDLCDGDPQCVKFCRRFPSNSRAALSYSETKGLTP